MLHWRSYNPQPQCDECGVFIPYERATLHERSDGMPLPSPVEFWEGLCVKCEAKLAAQADA